MVTRWGQWALLGCLAAAGLGCSHARVVERYGDGSGVVSIPDGTNSWPSRNHRHAEELIAKLCPGGYVIDREAEVTVGEVAHTTTATDTHGVPLLTPLGLAPSTATTEQTTSYQPVKEWHIWFRPKGAPPANDILPASAAGPAPR
jgi:hypothetical protein